MVKKIDKGISLVTRTVNYVSYICLLAIMVLIVIDVLARKLLQSGIPGSYEITERLLLVMIFAAFAYTQTEKGHIHVTLFLSRFPKALGLFFFGVFGLLSTAGSAICTYALWQQGSFSTTAGTITAVLKIPLAPFFYIAAVCMAVFTITLLWDGIKCFIGIGNQEISDEIRSVWE